jgi:hypothetical protein
MGPRRALGILVAGLAAWSCSLLLDDDYVDSAPPDAGPGEEASSDAAGQPDATTDAGPDGRFCASKAFAFCDDFDEGMLGGQWDQVVAEAGAPAFDDMTFRTAPRSMRIALLPGLSAGRTFLKKTFNQGPGFAVEADMMHAATGATSDIDLMTITVVPPPPGYQSYFVAVILENGGAVAEGYIYANSSGTDVTFRQSLAYSLPSFRRLTLELWETNMRVRAGSTVLFSRTNLPSVAASTTADVRVGAPHATTLDASVTLHYDNVVVGFGTPDP